MKLWKRKFIIDFVTKSLIIFSGSTLPVYAEWSPAFQISMGPASLNLGVTPLVIDKNSIALVGWLDGEIGVAEKLSSATLFPEIPIWTAPQVIYNNTITGLFPSFPTMAVDVFGNQIAGFGLIDPTTGALEINISRIINGNFNWQIPTTQSLNGGVSGGSLAIDDLGNFGILFATSTDGTPPFDITLLQLPANSSSWLVPLVLAQDNSSQPIVAAKRYRSNATLAWKDNSPDLQIQTRLFDFQTQQLSTLNNVQLPPLTTDILGMDMAVDTKGNSILIYAAQIGSNSMLYSSTLLAGESDWTTPLLISDPANTVINGSIASDAVGNTTIFWSEQITPSQQYVRAINLPLGSFPSLATNLTPKNSLNTTVDASARIVMDSFGNAMAIWGIIMGGSRMIQVSSKPIGQSWTNPETLSFSGISPLLVISDQGTAVATWLDNDANVLIGSRNLSVFDLAKPTDFVGQVIKNEFLTETAYFLKMSWKQSVAPNIVSYEIFKNGEVLASFSSNTSFEFLEHLQSNDIKDSYTLVATASNGNKSIPISILINNN